MLTITRLPRRPGGVAVRSDLPGQHIIASVIAHAPGTLPLPDRVDAWTHTLTPEGLPWTEAEPMRITRTDTAPLDPADIEQWALAHAADWEAHVVASIDARHAAHVQQIAEYADGPEVAAFAAARVADRAGLDAQQRTDAALAATHWLHHPGRLIQGAREVFWRMRGGRVQIGVVSTACRTPSHGWTGPVPEWANAPFQCGCGDLGTPRYYETLAPYDVTQAWRAGDSRPAHQVAVSLTRLVKAGSAVEIQV